MLQTNLKHVNSEAEYNQIINKNKNVMISCGRMGPMCVPVYATMKELEKEYPCVEFYDMEFDLPDASVMRNLPECRGFMGLPFTVYYKNGKVVQATGSIQNRAQIKEILENDLGQNNASS